MTHVCKNDIVRRRKVARKKVRGSLSGGGLNTLEFSAHVQIKIQTTSSASKKSILYELSLRVFERSIKCLIKILSRTRINSFSRNVLVLPLKNNGEMRMTQSVCLFIFIFRFIRRSHKREIG